MTIFRPCIDLHDGRVKQIVGGTLNDSGAGLRTNFIADQPAEWFAARYRADSCVGGHVIKLGPGNDDAARAALAAWPDGLHLGGGITLDNASAWIDAGAGAVIVTSWLFPDGLFNHDRLVALEQRIGRQRLVVDLSCRRRGQTWFVAINRWQTMTELEIEASTLGLISAHCSEFLIHAADVEGLCRGIDEELVEFLGRSSPIPCTYAGGAHASTDLALIERLSAGRIDVTFGSALDLFGGTQVRYADCVAWNRNKNTGKS